MAKETLHFKSKHTGDMKKAPVGYSWTMLLFSAFVPLLRGDWKWAVSIFISFVVLVALVVGFNPEAEYPESVCVWASFILGFFYNKSYVKTLIAKDYVVTSVENGDMAGVTSKLGIKLPLAE